MILLTNSVIIKLISTTLIKDSNGVGIPHEAAREVYADATSVTGNEWFEGGRAGINPEFRFIVFAHDYQGEESLEYNQRRYGVYRTYTDGDWIELYVEKRQGEHSLYPQQDEYPASEIYPNNTTFAEGEGNV